MPLILLRLFLRSLACILAFFLPGAFLVGYFQAWFVNYLGRSYHGTALPGMVDAAKYLLILCLWQGIQMSWQKQRLSQRGILAHKRVFWLIVPWSLLLSAFLSVLYQICFAITVFLIVQGTGELAHVSNVFTFLSSWLPNIKQVGLAQFFYLLVTMEPLVFGVFFVTCLFSYARLYSRLQNSDR